MRSSMLDSGERVMLLEIFLELCSRWSRFPIGGKQHQDMQPTVSKALDSLEEVLAQASMSSPFSKTVMITSLNAAWSASNSSMIDMFLSSFRSGEGTEILLKHVVIVCVDQKAFERCVGIRAIIASG